MITITFAGLPVTCYQDSELGYTISKKETVLLSGDIHANISTKQRSFPRSYKCCTDDYTEITNLQNKIGIFDTLVIETNSYSNCYISNIGSIFEIIRGYGTWTYEIEFSQADTGSSILSNPSPTVTTLVTNYVYVDQALAASASIESSFIDLTNCSDVNIYVSNTGSSNSLTVEIEGSYSSSGDIKTPVFVCTLNTAVAESGAPLASPPNFLFITATNNDSVNATTFTLIITKHVTV